jgi:4-methyl-5(b-hydroxyethyl)-thiazole monophosphate biosynthesis
MATCLVAIADGTEELEAVSVIDTLRRAGVRVTVASVDGRQVTCSRGVVLVADALIGDCVRQTYDAIVLPGGMPGAEHLRDSTPLTFMLQQQHAHGRLLAAICASPAVVLQHHGLIGARRATCYPGFEQELANVDRSGAVVVDGTCITSKGPGTALPFALAIVCALCGSPAAHKVAVGMLAPTT